MAEHSASNVVLGGENACYAHLVCDECGALLDAHHEQPCPLGNENVTSLATELLL
jgi:hypothetical protein